MASIKCCKDCVERKIGCHSKCKRYKEEADCLRRSNRWEHDENCGASDYEWTLSANRR